MFRTVSRDIGVPEEFQVDHKDCFMQVVDTKSVTKLVVNLGETLHFIPETI